MVDKNDLKNQKALEDKETTKVVSYGTSENQLVVETVASFGAMMNYKNYQGASTVYNKENLDIKVVPNPYDFKSSKEYRLVFSQVMKIVVNGQEADKTEANFDKVLDRNKKIFSEILTDILKASDDVGFILI